MHSNINIYNSSLNGIQIYKITAERAVTYLREFGSMVSSGLYNLTYLQSSLIKYMVYNRQKYLLNENVNNERTPKSTKNLKRLKNNEVYRKSQIQYEFFIPTCKICLRPDHTTESCQTKRIDVHNFGLTDDEIGVMVQSIIDKRHDIEVLWAWRNKITSRGAFEIARLINIPYGVNGPRQIVIKMNNISDDGIIQIAKSLNNLNNVEYLNVNSNSFSDRGGIAIAECLLSNKSLLHLEIEPLRPFEQTTLNAFVSSMKENTTLKHLRISRPEYVQHISERIIIVFLDHNAHLASLPSQNAIQALCKARAILGGISHCIPTELLLIITEYIGIIQYGLSYEQIRRIIMIVRGCKREIVMEKREFLKYVFDWNLEYK